MLEREEKDCAEPPRGRELTAPGLSSREDRLELGEPEQPVLLALEDLEPPEEELSVWLRGELTLPAEELV